MEPLLLISVPGVLGGVLVALVLTRVRRRTEAESLTRLQPPSPSLINMAHIPVEGLGGLGMVATAATVAIFIPRIRVTVAIALLLGVAFATVLIARRRRHGPLPSSSHHSGAHSMFIDDEPREPKGGRSALRSRMTAGAPALVAGLDGLLALEPGDAIDVAGDGLRKGPTATSLWP